MNLFVTGTDTSVGKTIVSSILCLKLNWKYWKPIQSGTSEITDSNFVKEFANPKEVIQESYCLRSPLSPHTSSEMEGIKIDLDLILDRAKGMDKTVIEGAGGLLVPINRDFLVIDLIQKLKIRPLLVSRSGLGTINHTLLSIEALRNRKIEPLGVVMVGEKNQANRISIESYGKIKVLGEVPLLPKIDRSVLVEAGKLIEYKGEN
jgi:dethiobiotin synthetase